MLWKSSLQTVTKRDTKRDQSIWSALHARPAAEFFEQAWKKGKELPANRGRFAYLYGFICHFALDHSCHGYIEEKIQKSGVTHAEIEVEFDRMLLEKHGHNPITSHLTNHIPTDATCAGVIAEFFPEVTDEQWNDWKWQVKNRIETVDQLKKYLDLKGISYEEF